MTKNARKKHRAHKAKKNHTTEQNKTLAKGQHRIFWERWIPLREHMWKKSIKTNKTKSNFYVIFTGSNRGIYYKWSDCIPHIQRDNTAQFKGYQNLTDAYRALERMKNSSHIYA